MSSLELIYQDTSVANEDHILRIYKLGKERVRVFTGTEHSEKQEEFDEEESFPFICLQKWSFVLDTWVIIHNKSFHEDELDIEKEMQKFLDLAVVFLEEDNEQTQK